MGYNLPVAIRCYLFVDSVGEIARWFEERPEGLMQVCMLALPPYFNSSLRPLELDQEGNHWSEESLKSMEQRGKIVRVG